MDAERPAGLNTRMARACAGPYETYEGSPVSRGILQQDMWGVKEPSQRWDWAGLRADIARHGVRNSLLLAPMPTASTSQVRPVSSFSATSLHILS